MPNELLPTNIQFGTVVGRFGSAPLIAGDADGLPDFSPATGLTVTFTPSTAAVIDATASPAPVTIEMVPIVCGLDTQGYLVGGDGQRGVKLIATNDTDINPSGWTYSVTFLRGGAKVAAFRDFSMSLPAGVAKDIALTIPVPSSEGVSLSQAQAAEAAAVSAASQASAAAAAAAASAATFVPATVDTLGQATTVGKAIAKAATQVIARTAIDAAGLADTNPDAAERKLYVSTRATASDSNPGLTRARPKATIAAAITALGAVGGIIELGMGTHVLTSTLSIPSSTVIRGVGLNPANGIPTKLDGTAVTSGPVILFNGVSESAITDLYITGPSSGATNVIQTTGNCRGITLERVTVNCGVTGEGVFFGLTGSVIRSAIQGVTVVGAGNGFRIGGACTSITMTNCYANANTVSGYNIQGTYIALVACAADANGLNGYTLQNAVSVPLMGCGAENNARSAFYLTNATGITLTSCRSVANNTAALSSVGSLLSINDASDYVTAMGCVDTTPNAATVNSILTASGTAGTNITLLNNKTSLPVKAQLVSRVKTGASNATGAGLNIPHGATPTAAIDGDVWTTTGGVFAQVNGATSKLIGNNDSAALSSATVVGATTTGTLLTGGSPPNLLTAQQADFEAAGSAGWTLAPSNCASPSTSTAVALHGARCMEIVSNAVHTCSVRTPPQAASAGLSYTAMASFRSSGTNTRSFYTYIRFLDAGSATLATVIGNTVISTGSNWAQSVVSATAPAGTTQMYVNVACDVLNVGGAGESYYVDCVSVVNGPPGAWQSPSISSPQILGDGQAFTQQAPNSRIAVSSNGAAAVEVNTDTGTGTGGFVVGNGAGGTLATIAASGGVGQLTIGKITGLSNGVALSDAATVGQLGGGANLALKPTAALFETLPRAGGPNITSAGTAVGAGTLWMTAIYIPAGVVVSSLSFKSGSTAAVSPTNWWFGLYDSSRVQLATTANQTTTAWAASTLMTLAVATVASGAAASFTTTYSGLHYLGIMVAATTPPSILSATVSAGITALPPIQAGTSNTALTAPPGFPTTAAALTATSTPLYGFVS